MNKAFFFDRDGVVNYRIVGQYVDSPAKFKFIDDFFDFFRLVKTSGFLAVLVTNQQGVGKGLMSEEDLAGVHEYMQQILFKRAAYKFDDIFFCPALESENSLCRKPNPGMALSAIKKWNIDAEQSWLVGDRKSDIIAGKRAGLRTIKIGSEQFSDPKPDISAKNFFEIKSIL